MNRRMRDRMDEYIADVNAARSAAHSNVRAEVQAVKNR